MACGKNHKKYRATKTPKITNADRFFGAGILYWENKSRKYKGKKRV